MANFQQYTPFFLIACAWTTVLNAADKAPSVSFSGWTDNILRVSDDNTVDDPSTLKKESAATTRFSSVASLKANWTVGEDVSGRINVWIHPAGASDDQVVLTEAFVIYQINNAVGIQMGKTYSVIGLVGAEPADLLTVNPSIAGSYWDNYGNNPIGVNLLLTPGGDKGSLSASVGVNNGNFTGSDAYNGSPNGNRNNSDLGFVGEVTYALCEAAKVNIETAYDRHSDTNTSNTATPNTNALGGNVFYMGMNATIKPISPLTIGAELQSFHYGTGSDEFGNSVGGVAKIYQGMLMANYVLPDTPFPMSVTLSDQYMVKINHETALTNDGSKSRTNGLQAALLTNPTGSSNFAVNVEVGYSQVISEADPSTAKTNSTGWETALEAYVSF